MKIFKYLFLTLLFAPLGAHAASVDVQFNPTSSGPVFVGDIVDVDVIFDYSSVPNPGDFFAAGHFNLYYDDAIVSLIGITSTTTPNTVPWFNGNQTQSPGMVEDVGFGYDLFSGPGLTTGLYHAATFQFQAMAIGTGILSLDEFSLDPFMLSNGGLLNDAALGHSLTFQTGSITVSAVPLPAAAWLMLSGLGALGFIGRRRRTSRQ